MTSRAEEFTREAPLAPRPQLGVDARCPVRLSQCGLDRAHPLHQRRVCGGVRRRPTTSPRAVARLQHAQHAHHGRDRETGLICAREPENPDGSTTVSRANQAAAFDRISRSTRNCRTSRRSTSSSRSATARPGGTASRRPWSCPDAWCSYDGSVTNDLGRAGIDQAAIRGRLTTGLSLNPATDSRLK